MKRFLPFSLVVVVFLVHDGFAQEQRLSDEDTQLLGSTLKMLSDSQGAGIDKRRDETCQKLIDLFAELENRVKPDWNVEIYKQFVITNTDPIFDSLQARGKNLPDGWKRVREEVLKRVEAQANGSLDEFRRLLKVPVKRALETEIFRITGITKKTPVGTTGDGTGGDLGGLTNDELRLLIEQSFRNRSGGTYRRGRSRSCFDLLLGF